MQLSEAITMIEKGIADPSGNWADIGAGTGLFTLALGHLLREDATVYAVDKNPHGLYRLTREISFNMEIVEADFTKSLEDLPALNGIVMANALHYAKDPAETMRKILSKLEAGGTFILIEYDTRRAVPIWVPYPVPFSDFQKIAQEVGLSAPEKLQQRPSIYGNGMIYAAACTKIA